MDLTVRNGRLSDLDRVWEIENRHFRRQRRLCGRHMSIV